MREHNMPEKSPEPEVDVVFATPEARKAPPEREPPAVTGCINQPRGIAQVDVRLDAGVLASCWEHAARGTPREVGGVLVGWSTPTVPPCIVVEDAIEADAVRNDRTSVTFTHDSWSSIFEVLDRDPDARQIVGWYHSHPGFGAFYSAQDRFTHLTCFPDPASIGIVIDPVRGGFAAFVSNGSGAVSTCREVGLYGDLAALTMRTTLTVQPRRTHADPASTEPTKSPVARIIPAAADGSEPQHGPRQSAREASDAYKSSANPPSRAKGIDKHV